MTELTPITCAYFDRPAGTASEWLRVIRRANTLAESKGEKIPFGQPTEIGCDPKLGCKEVYEEAIVNQPPSVRGKSLAALTATITPLTERAQRLITQALDEVRAEDG